MADETKRNREGRRSLLVDLLERYLEGKLGPLGKLAEISFAQGEEHVLDRRRLLMQMAAGVLSGAIKTKEEQLEELTDDPMKPDADQSAMGVQWIESLLDAAGEAWEFEVSVSVGLFSYSYESMRFATASLHTTRADVVSGRGMMSPDFLIQLDPSTLSKEQVEKLQHKAEKLQENVSRLHEDRTILQGYSYFLTPEYQNDYISDVRKVAERKVEKLQEGSERERISSLSGVIDGKELSGAEYYIESEVLAAKEGFRRARALVIRRPTLLDAHIEQAEQGLQLWQQTFTAWSKLQQEKSAYNTAFGAMARRDHYRPASACSIHTWNYSQRPVVHDVVAGKSVL